MPIGTVFKSKTFPLFFKVVSHCFICLFISIATFVGFGSNSLLSSMFQIEHGWFILT